MIAAILSLAGQNFENRFTEDVTSTMENTEIREEMLIEGDIEKLPNPVQNYLRYTGAIGKPKVKNVKIIFEGKMRNRQKDGFLFTSEQYNFFDDSTCLFLINATVKPLPTNGCHSYGDRSARMHIKLLLLFSVVDLDMPELFRTETVTFFNGKCLFIPAALIDDRIEWETIDEFSAKATFNINGACISAILYFNKRGQLVDFVPNDRYSVAEVKVFPFLTRPKNYKTLSGCNIAKYGEAM